MEGQYLRFFLFFAGICGVFSGASVNLTLSNQSPTVGDNRVDMVCVYNTDSGYSVKYVYIDLFKSQHAGWKSLVKYDVSENTFEYQSEGDAIKSRLETSSKPLENTITLSYTSVNCGDTRFYKCDLTLNKHHHEKEYHYNQAMLNVTDTSGEVCGSANSNVFSVAVIAVVVAVSAVFR